MCTHRRALPVHALSHAACTHGRTARQLLLCVECAACSWRGMWRHAWLQLMSQSCAWAMPRRRGTTECRLLVTH